MAPFKFTANRLNNAKINKLNCFHQHTDLISLRLDAHLITKFVRFPQTSPRFISTEDYLISYSM